MKRLDELKFNQFRNLANTCGRCGAIQNYVFSGVLEERATPAFCYKCGKHWQTQPNIGLTCTYIICG